MRKLGIAAFAALTLVLTVWGQTVGKRVVGWAETVADVLSLTPSREAYVYITKGLLYATNYDGVILAYDPTSTATVNNSNVWAPDSGIGRWILLQGGGTGGGTITLAVPDGLSVSGSPVIGSGGFTISTILNSIIKGTGTGFTNANPATDFVAPGLITTSGLTMPGTNLLGRYSSGTGAVQIVNIGNGLTMVGTSLLNTATNFGVINPTDTFIPYRSNSTVYADSQLSANEWGVIITKAGTNNAWLRSNGAIVSGPDAMTNLYGGFSNIVLYAFSEQHKQDSPDPVITMKQGDGLGGYSLISMSTYVVGPLFSISNLTNSVFNEVQIFDDGIYESTANGGEVSLFPGDGWAGHGDAPFFFSHLSTNLLNTNIFLVRYLSTNVFSLKTQSGYGGTGTQFLSDDGGYKPAGATINSTDGYLPYRSSATAFSDSPIYRINAGSVGISTTTNALTAAADTMAYTNNSGTPRFEVRNSDGNQIGMSTATTGSSASLSASSASIIVANNIQIGGDLLGYSSTRNIGGSTTVQAFNNLWMQGHHYLYGSGLGTANYHRLDFNNTGTNGAVIFDSQTGGINTNSTPSEFNMRFNGTNGFRVVSGGSIVTGDPASGAGQWKLGTTITGATVSLVTTNYVEVSINGTVVKLAIVQ